MPVYIEVTEEFSCCKCSIDAMEIISWYPIYHILKAKRLQTGMLLFSVTVCVLVFRRL